jgi:hypothetical protein
LVFVVFLFVVSASAAPQQLPHPKGYVAHRSGRIWVEGRLDEESWRLAPWSETFVDIEGDVKAAPRHQTRVKMLWDNVYLYIGAELVEPHLWATLKDHDAVIFRDNDFEVFIDPNGDNHEYYELEINALGTTWDLFLPKPYKDGGKAVDSFEIAGMKSAVFLDGTLNNSRDQDRGWTVELALPWKAFGTGTVPRDGDQWRINFSRVQWQLDRKDGQYQKVPNTKEDNWVWSPQSVIDMHRPERWGYVQFSADQRGPVAFRPNAEQEARDFLHAAYYSQREFKKKNNRWATTFGELGLREDDTFRSLAPTIRIDGDQFEITARMNGQATPLTIRQDSLITGR